MTEEQVPTAFSVARKQGQRVQSDLLVPVLTFPKQRAQQDEEGQTERPGREVWAHGQDSHFIPAAGGLTAGG